MDLSTVSTSITATYRPDTDARLHGTALRLTQMAWVLIGLMSMGMFVASLSPYYAALITFSGAHTPTEAVRVGLRELGVSVGVYAAYHMAVLVAIMLVFVAVGGLIFWRKGNDRAALFFSSVLVVFGSIWPNTMSALTAQYPAFTFVAEFLDFYGFTFFFLLCYVFPDGRFVPRWTRWVALAIIVEAILGFFFPRDNPALERFEPLLGIVFISTLVFAQVYRYRHISTPIQRQQTKWVMFSLVAALVCFIGTAILERHAAFNQPGAPAALFSFVALISYGVAFMLVPVTIGIAVLRYRLWDIDPIVNRTLVYGALTACVIALYVIIVAYLSTLFQVKSSGQGGLPLQLIATGVVAVLFQPLCEQLQRGVNRLMYGERDEPYAVLSRLGQRLEATLAPETVLPTVVETVREALKLPYAAMMLNDERKIYGQQHDSIVAASGTPVTEPLIWPLVYQHETVGQLLLGRRAVGEEFSPADHRLLDDLARQAGIAVHAVRLTHDLQQSREHLVTAREEERRRLRRDLHDGLGPTLASLTMKLDVAQALVVEDPNAGVELLAEIRAQMKQTIANVRRLVYALRPPVLDQFGLVAAIREQALQHARTQAQPEGAVLQVIIDAPEHVPPLPAAVEVAAYYIAVEAITNVVRHAHAQQCSLRLRISGELDLEIVDNGIGLPVHVQSGIGLQSMRERAVELGGTCTIEALPTGGTRVRARLPLAP